MLRLQAELVEYKLIKENQIALKFYVADFNNEKIYAYFVGRIDSKQMQRFQKCIAFSNELYSEEIDLDNIIDKKHLIGVICEINTKGNLIVEDFFKISDEYLYDDLVRLGMIDSDQKVIEEIKKHKEKQPQQQQLFEAPKTLFG